MKASDFLKNRVVGVAGVCAAIAGTVAANILMARRTERRNPARGGFIEVDGVRLHYTDGGQGSEIVLIHGNEVSGDDWESSCVADLLRLNHRVVIFDRPGFGHSTRTSDRIWTANRQADLLHEAFCRLNVERPVVVGHSWGAMVAIALGLRYQADLAGLVLISGYYFASPRLDALMAVPGALPVIGDLFRYSVLPLLGWLRMPALKWQIFSPARVTKRFRAEYSNAMALRPSQLRAASQDGVLMIPSVLGMQKRYGELNVPVTIMAGVSDRLVVHRQSARLAANLPGSVVHMIRGAGHMVHYLVPHQVAEAVTQISKRASLRSDAR